MLPFLMTRAKVVRSVCLFTRHPSDAAIARLATLTERLVAGGFNVQTRRLCSPDIAGVFDLDRRGDGTTYLSVGRLGLDAALQISERFCDARNVSFNLELANETITEAHVRVLATIIRTNGPKTFSFTYTFNNVPSTPYYPSASFERDGFAIGLQSTDLSEGCRTVDEWLDRVRASWAEAESLLATEEGYLGLDTSVAPLFGGKSSLIGFIKRIGLDFDRAVTTDLFLRIAASLTREGPRRVGLCGLMFPCLEDFELAAEYEAGRFPVERCLFLALHSGLGLDAYPVGVDEHPDRIAEVLRLAQGLSNKHRKPLSVRLLSDGVARIGQRTDFRSPFLSDVTIRPL
jgi:hypothetical protein